MIRAAILIIFFAGQIFAWAGETPTSLPAQPVSQEQLQRGARLYSQYCALCHQPSGRGTPPLFPPLAESDFLAADKERSVRILITGLNGAITVRNQIYNNVMPPAPYNDEQLADVLTYVENSFGNSNGVVTTEQVKKIHGSIASADVLTDPNPYPPLPAAPSGFTLREVVRLPANPTRITGDGTGRALYVLSEPGDVWRVELPSGAMERVIACEDYAGPPGSSVSCDGFGFDAQKRLYITSDHNIHTQPYESNEVTIYRTEPFRDGVSPAPKPWLRVMYPWGVGPFNHGVNHIALGPDGYLYVNSGSRTDGDETGNDPHYYPGGEVPLTSCIWRLDPRSEHPEVEIFARGLRNSYGFCWNDRGEMFATENGPDQDAPEELNQIERGKHYGFPYRFSNWTKKAYPYSPEPPPGIQFTLPIANLGPDAGGSVDHPLYTFDPHSSPAGIVFLGNDFPPDYRGTFLVARFGNLIKLNKDVGFDLLQVRLTKNSKGVYEANIKTVLSPLARPLDLLLDGHGNVYICEYTRVLDNSGKLAMLPGRLLELSVKK